MLVRGLPGAGGAFGTSIVGNFAGPLLAYNAAGTPASGEICADSLGFNNSHAAGWGLQLEGVFGATLTGLHFSGGNGLKIGALRPTNTEIQVSQLTLDGNLASYPSGIGCTINGVGNINVCRATQWFEGLRLSRSMNISGKARLENNIIGLRLGVDPSGNGLQSIGTYANVQTEACNYAVQVTKGAYLTKFSGLRVYGTGNTVSGFGGLPVVGLDLQAGCGRATVDTSEIVGSFGGAAVNVYGSGPFRFLNSNVSNDPKGGGSGIVYAYPASGPPPISWI
jgi:hypothetical protein